MTVYEIISIIISIVAVVTSNGIHLYNFIKEQIEKAKLKYYSTGRAYLFCNKSGSYIRMEGVYCAFNKFVIVNKTSINVERKKDDCILYLEWSTFISPIVQSNNAGFSSIMETAHPFRVDADNIYCAFTEFSDSSNAFIKKSQPYFDKLNCVINRIDKFNNTYYAAERILINTDEYKKAEELLYKELYWETGEYAVILHTYYNKDILKTNLSFTVSEKEIETLKSNIKEILVADLKKAYGLQTIIQPVIIELAEE